MKYILIEHADGNDPYQVQIFNTPQERERATVEAIMGPDGKREDVTGDMETLMEDKILHFEGDPSLEWIEADVPELTLLTQTLEEGEKRYNTLLLDKLKWVKEIELLTQANKRMREAIQIAISTVECASICPNTGEELPWHKQAVAALLRPPEESLPTLKDVQAIYEQYQKPKTE